MTTTRRRRKPVRRSSEATVTTAPARRRGPEIGPHGLPIPQCSANTAIGLASPIGHALLEPAVRQLLSIIDSHPLSARELNAEYGGDRQCAAAEIYSAWLVLHAQSQLTQGDDLALARYLCETARSRSRPDLHGYLPAVSRIGFERVYEFLLSAVPHLRLLFAEQGELLPIE